MLSFSKLKVGNVFKFPAIKLCPDMEANYLAFCDFRKWVTKKDRCYTFNNSTSSKHAKLYEDYCLHRITFNPNLRIFNRDINNYKTYFVNVDNNVNHLDMVKRINKNNIYNEVRSIDEKNILSHLIKTDGYTLIKPHNFVKIFGRFEVNNYDANKQFYVRAIDYGDNDIIRLTCEDLKETQIRFFVNKYTSILTKMDIEIYYFNQPGSHIVNFINEQYTNIPIDEYQFEIMN